MSKTTDRWNSGRQSVAATATAVLPVAAAIPRGRRRWRRGAVPVPPLFPPVAVFFFALAAFLSSAAAFPSAYAAYRVGGGSSASSLVSSLAAATIRGGRGSSSSSPPHPPSGRLRPSSPWPLRLVPLSEAWDAAGKVEPFALLIPGLGCPSLDSGGRFVSGKVFRPAMPPSPSSPSTAYQIEDSDSAYCLYVATTEDDLPPVAQLTVDVFDATAINLSSSNDWSEWERAFLNPIAGGYNAYARGVAYTEVLTGLRLRTSERRRDSDDGEVDTRDWLAPFVNTLSSGDGDKKADDEDDDAAGRKLAAASSLILVLARTKGEDRPEIEAVASVELRLQPTDAKIPFSQPWLDAFERSVAARFLSSSSSERGRGIRDLQPYLSNLSVSPSLRGKGAGRALVRIVAAIARKRWGYKRLYLHVDPDNAAAFGLYEKEGFVDVGRRWDPFWAGTSSEIGYFVKTLIE